MSTQAMPPQGQQRVEDATRHDTFLRLIGQYEAALRRLAAGYVVHAADREDLFQEIAVGLWRAIPAYRGEASERTWLYRIAHNIAISSSTRLHRRGKNGSVALFMGKRAVEKAATWKSPTTGLSHSTWKSRNRSGISHFFHRATTADLLVRLFAVTKIAELRRTRLVCVCQNKD